MESLGRAAAELRDAIAAHSFERASELLRECGALLRNADPAAIGEAAAELADLRRQAVARRAHLAARLEELHRLTPYLRSAPPQRRLHVEG